VCDDRGDPGTGGQVAAQPGDARFANFHPASLARVFLHLPQGAAKPFTIDQGKVAHRASAAEQAAQKHGEGSSGVTDAFMPGGGDSLMTGTATLC